MPLGIPAFLGTAISVLLSFKMSQSYGRWWEARKVWGGIVNDSRSLVIQLQSYLGANHVKEIEEIAHKHDNISNNLSLVSTRSYLYIFDYAFCSVAGC